MEKTGIKVTGNEEFSGGRDVEPWVDLQLRNLTWTGSEGHHLRSREGRLFFVLVIMRKISVSYINLAKAFIRFGVLGSLGLL